MQSSIKVYYDTGFNGVDIPADASVLQSAASRTYLNPYFIREDIDKPSIRINDSYENLCAVDYCEITTNRGTSYYYAEPKALSAGVTLLSLDLDGLLTMGGVANLDYISGWQERGHIAPADDTLFSNIAAEDWLPSQPLVTKNMTTLKMTSDITDDLDVVISNIDLGALGTGPVDEQSIITGIDSGGNAAMYLPFIQAPSTHTGFFMHDFAQNTDVAFTIPNTAAYDASVTTVRQGLQKLYSCGQLQLQASYKLPKEYVKAIVPASDGRITNITGNYGNITLNDLPFQYTEGGYTPKNKKVYSTFRTYSIVNVGSGDMSCKSPEDIYDGSSLRPTVRLWTDMCSTGKPYARFSYIKGSPIQFSDCVRGLQWANSQLVMEGASGSLWNSIDNAFANRSIESEKAFSTYSRQIGMKQTEIAGAQARLANPGSMVDQSSMLGSIAASLVNATVNKTSLVAGAKGAASGALNLMSIQNQERLNAGQYALAQRQYDQQINQNNIGLIRSNQVVAPSVSFTPEQNLGLYGYNYFVVYETRKSLADLKSEDMYYQKYGYNGLHRPLTAQCFNERQYYCYVQAFDVNLKGNDAFGLRVRSKAISQLNGGVRVWKVLPDASYYELN